MFLKCFYNLEGKVDVDPIYLPIGNDGALSSTLTSTLINQYLQVRRWGWGASDISFALNEAVHRREIPFARRYLRFWYVFENHISWSTQWFFITLGGLIPWVIDIAFGVKVMPEWFTWASRAVLTPCLIPYLIIIGYDWYLRPPAPASITSRSRALATVHWLFIGPISFFCSALPALDAQIRLMLGRRMEYRVTEKV
jgi:hypothetical protein